MEHTDDFTLMTPTGGPVTGAVTTEAELTAMERFFERGEAALEVVQTYASGDLAVLVVVEHQQGEVGEYPAQDWSPRVTVVFRREGSRWRLVHRHADALARPISFDRLAELARW
jgi:ketosteroid isomerase-like protein